MIEAEVAPVLHEYVVPPDAVSVVDCPAQREVFPEMEEVGNGFTVMVIEVSSEQEPPETITVYVVVAVGETKMDEVVAPVFQENDDPPEAVRVALLPEQMAAGPLTLGVIAGVTVTVATADAEQNPFVTFTV